VYSIKFIFVYLLKLLNLKKDKNTAIYTENESDKIISSICKQQLSNLLIAL